MILLGNRKTLFFNYLKHQNFIVFKQKTLIYIVFSFKYQCFMLLPILFYTLCSLNLTGPSYQTECVSIETDGYFIIKIWDTKKGQKYSSEEARKDAIAAILYSGISGSRECTTQLPILNTTEKQENFKSIRNSFFAKQGKWSMFTRSSATETTIPNSVAVRSWKVYQVSVSKKELRKYLEEQKIIKSLTNGF